MDKVREEFEMWLNTKGINFDFSIYLNKYTDKKIQNRYEGWKASRESIIVQLPENCKGNALTVSELKEQLDKVGIKYDF
ncbi:hypothetical protein BNNNBJKE_00038 [Aeromonas phage vB_AdhM_DL]|nr:hypothetical protein BNCALIDO_00094 [Aeromonas phage vB_AdhM_TS9]WBF79622.1 hypothetical protein BNNNBJKE_00038 [Aeromonas phage vB_AdhM_DL]